MEAEIGNIVEAVTQGFSRAAMAAKLDELDARKGDIAARVAALEGDRGQR